MTSAALALATRSLMLDTRALRPMLTRCILLLLLIATLSISREQGRFLGAPGQHMLGWLLNIDFWLLTILGISAFAGVITEEKEAMTLGLLKLAGFGSVSILLGKSVGHLLAALLLLAVQLPFAVLAIAMGGVSDDSVLGGFAVLAAYLLFVFSVALLCSVLSRRTATAARWTAVLVLGWSFAPAMLADVAGELWGTGAAGLVALLEEWAALSVFGALRYVGRTGFAFGVIEPAVTANLLAAAAVTLAAGALFGRANRQEWTAAEARRGAGRVGGRSRPGAGRRALVWKDFRYVAGGRAAIVWRLLLYGALYAYFMGSSTAMPWGGTMTFAIMLLPWLLIAFALDFGFTASRFLHEEVKWQTLPGLAILPLETTRWTYGKAWGCWLARWPTALALGLCLLILISDENWVGTDGTAVVLMGYYFANVTLGMHVAAYLSLVMRRGAFAATLGLFLAGQFFLGLLMTTCMRGSGDPTGMFGLLAFGLFVAALCLQPQIGAKLREVAGR